MDVAHGGPAHAGRGGALTLRRALPYFDPGVHLAVVDPQVGAERRSVALLTAEESRVLVGPDNGLLSLAATRFGGVVEAVEIGRAPLRLQPAVAPFHRPGVFAPVPPHLPPRRSLPGA